MAAFNQIASEPVLGEEPDASKSLSATLKLVAAKGYIAKQEKRGEKRSRDKEPRSKNERDYKPEINLQYTDDSGRKLDEKEAFRYLCYKFHGKGPGKNKIDKRLRKQELNNKVKTASDVPPSAALMISKQKELQTPYIILSKGK